MTKQEFVEDETYLPVTMKQFEALTNEMLTALNVLSSPQLMDPETMAQYVHASIHHIDHSTGIIKKSELFEACVNRISNNLTFKIAEGIHSKREAEKAKLKTANGEVPLELVPRSRAGTCPLNVGIL
jgi:hypothetical protein